MSSNPFISGTFAVRNLYKTTGVCENDNGFRDQARIVPCVGQFANSLKSAQSGEYGNALKTCANSIFDAVNKIAPSGNSIWEGAKKVVKFSADHTNLLLCGASGVRILTAEDKEHQATKEVFAMGTMFASESAMKQIRQSLDLKSLANKSQNKFVKAGIIALDAALQVGTSIIAYDTGAKIGNYICPKKDKSIDESIFSSPQTLSDLTSYSSQNDI